MFVSFFRKRYFEADMLAGRCAMLKDGGAGCGVAPSVVVPVRPAIAPESGEKITRNCGEEVRKVGSKNRRKLANCPLGIVAGADGQNELLATQQTKSEDAGLIYLRVKKLIPGARFGQPSCLDLIDSQPKVVVMVTLELLERFCLDLRSSPEVPLAEGVFRFSNP